MSRAPKKILIVAMRQIGDTLITTPLISKAKRTWPDAEIDFLGFKNSVSILSGNPDIHSVIACSQKPKFPEYWSLFKRLFKRYDLALITQPNDRSYIFGILSAWERYGVVPNDRKQGWWKRLLCSRTVEVDYYNQHVVTEKLKLIRGANFLEPHGIEVTPPRSENLPTDINDLLKINSSAIVIHATPLGGYKRISLSVWHELINKLAHSHQIFLTGSNGESDKQLNAEILAGIDPKLKDHVSDLSGQLTFGQTTNLLSKAKLYIGVDTSISHLAAACNTPSIVLFGPTPPTNFGPWPNGFTADQPYMLKGSLQTVGNISIIQGPGDCVPCRKAGCENSINSPSKCLLSISAQTIIDCANQKLSSN